MRECGNCTACCGGTLAAMIRGYEMGPGKPCHFVKLGVGCKDYKNRPEKPCKIFQCKWLIDNSLPDSLRPDKSGVIILKDGREVKIIYN